MGKVAQSTIKGFGEVDDEVLDYLLKPNVPGNKGFNTDFTDLNLLYV